MRILGMLFKSLLLIPLQCHILWCLTIHATKRLSLICTKVRLLLLLLQARHLLLLLQYGAYIATCAQHLQFYIIKCAELHLLYNKNGMMLQG